MSTTEAEPRRRKRGVVVTALVAAVLAVPAVSTAGQLRSGDNLRLGTDANPTRGKQAPGLAVNPANPDHVVEVHIDMLKADCEFNASFDGGATWTGGVLKAPLPYPQSEACSLVGHGATAMDASVAFGSGSTVYTTWAPALPGMGNTAMVSRSTDGGRTFQEAKIALVGGPVQRTGAGTFGVGPNYAYPKIAVVPGGGSNGQDKIVLAATNTVADPGHGATGTVVVAVSNDGGSTWPASGTVASTKNQNAQEHTQIVVGRDGALYVAWRQPDVGTGTAKAGTIQIAESNDDGQTWVQTVVTGVRAPGSFCCSSFPRLAIDRNAAAGDVLYLVWSQDPGLYAETPQPRMRAQDHFMNQDSDVWIIRSTDGAATWTDRKQVNDAPFPGEVTQTRHPNVSVAPDGRVDVVWHDRRHWYKGCTHTHARCDEARLGDTYLASSNDGGLSFGPNRRITDRSMNNDVGYDYRFGTYWDYGPVAAPRGTDKVLVAWMDAREGNIENDTQDIYLANVDLAAAGPAPVRSIAEGKKSELSVSLSRYTYPGGPEAVLAGTFSSRPFSRVVIAPDSNNAAEALPGSVLARANIGSLLLSPAEGLPDAVKAEVSRMDPVGAYVLGDSSQLSDQVVTDLVAAGVPAGQVERLQGAPDQSTSSRRAGNAAAVALAMDRRTTTEKTALKPAFDAVVIAKPGDPLAAAASALAVNRRLPFLYVDTDAVPQATRDALAALNVNKALVVGGVGTISDGVVAQLAAASVSPTRLATDLAVLDESIARGLPTNQVFVAKANSPLHATLLGAAAGRAGGLLLLAHDARTTDAQATLDALGLAPRVDRLLTGGK